MRRVYLLQPNNVISNKAYLPYAVGTLAAYAWQFDEIKKEYDLSGIFYKKDDAESVCSIIDNPFLIGFSCYIWNIDYNLVLAQQIKSKWPDCFIVFGGQQVPDNTLFLQQYPYIDFLIHGEGEQTFYNLLMVLSSKGPLSEVNNLSYRQGKELVHTEKKVYKDLSTYPSPYTTGIFDELLERGRREGIDFDAVLETNRGCPYGCIYCYWAGTETNFRIFPIERVKRDIYWISSYRIDFCICADSNFGILERDKDIVDYIIECKRVFGYPKMFETAAAKNKDDVVFEIHKNLNDEKLCCGISMAVQSFSPEVLANIGRKNIPIDNFAKQLKKYREAGMSTYTDIILALPGETYESFCRGIFCAIESGQHNLISIHPLEVLPNTKLYSDEIREKYQIRTIRAMNQDHALYDPENLTFSSRAEVVVSTNTMDEQNWCKAMRLATTVQSLHSFGLLKYISIYLRKAKGVSYYDFYMQLYEWIETKTDGVKKIFDRVFHSLDLVLSGNGGFCYYDPTFSDSYLYLREGLFLCCAKELELFYKELIPYLSPYFDDEELFFDLLKYQSAKIKRPGDPETFMEFRFDWEDYYKDIFDDTYVYPKKTDSIYVAEACEIDNWRDYTYSNIWFGKRENKMIRKFRKKEPQSK